MISPWIYNLDIKINASDFKINEVCKYLTNTVSLKIKCSEGKNTDFKKKIVGMKFTEADDVSNVLTYMPNLVNCYVK